MPLPSLRFSLRSLIVLVLLMASGMGLWWRWEPWAQTVVLPHSTRVFCGRFSPNERLVVTGSNGTQHGLCVQFCTWDAQTGDKLTTKEFTYIRNSEVGAMFLPDGNSVTFLLGGEIESAWDARSGIVLDAHPFRTVGPSIPESSAKMTLGIVPLNDHSASIFETQTGTPVWKLVGHTDRVWDAKLSSDEQRAITASWDRTARIWDARTGTELMILEGHKGQLVSGEFSQSGRWAVTTSDDGTARLWYGRRPEYWWGIAWLPEFWLTVVCLVGLGCSAWRDQKQMEHQ